MRLYNSVFAGFVIGSLLLGTAAAGNAFATDSASEWVAALHAATARIRSLADRERAGAAQAAWRDLERRFPLASDWMLQDAPDELLWAHVPAGGRDGWRSQRELLGGKLADLLTDVNADRWITMTERVLAEVGGDTRLAEELSAVGRGADEVTLVGLYLRACQARRSKRLSPWLSEGESKTIVFSRHFNMGGSHYAYTEALSDAQSERNYRAGSSLCLLRLDSTGAVVETLLDSPEGVIRDVDVSWDGKTILFSWKKSDRGDDYSLYTMDAATREITVIADDLGHADYEGVFLPNGDIVFNSTRCVQIVDCWWTEVSNLYTCGPDGRFLRRLSFDQVHTNYPTVTADGRVLYTRWDYNDRGQLYPQGLFQMFPDGTAQMEFYGNTSWFPTTILPARGIPGTQKVLTLFTGHHSLQAGKLGVLDPSLGRQENQGAQLVAPIRETPAERIDAYGQEGDLFMYPWPLDERHFLVSYAPRGWEDGGNGRYETVFGLYFMDMDGRRELLDLDTEKGISTGRMAPLEARTRPHVRPSTVDYTKDTGVYYVQDVYEGPGLEGVQRGTIKNLRVIALEYRAAGVGNNSNHGPAGGAMLSTPISIYGAWDVKTVLGRATVHEDGSAMFAVPAQTPVYFQALDEKGHAVQTMRTWSTLQPGEFSSCVGCHSLDKHAAPVLHKSTRAMRAGAQPLEPYYGAPEGFSFRTSVQPILDQNCVSCHNDRHDPRVNIPRIAATASSTHENVNQSRISFSALSNGIEPENSSDRRVSRFTWPGRRQDEWVQYNFDSSRTVDGVEVYWLDERPRSRSYRAPASWQLLYREGRRWREVSNPSGFTVERDTYNRVTFDAVETDALRLVVRLEDGYSGGILSWNVLPQAAVEPSGNGQPLRAFSLLGIENPDPVAKRAWSDAYLALIGPSPDASRSPSEGPVQWIHPQSVPTLLPAYHTGATQSPMIQMLENGHHDVTLSPRDLLMLALWIDLTVPYVGDYTEANVWSESEERKYEHFLDKRRRMEAIERNNIQALIDHQRAGL